MQRWDEHSLQMLGSQHVASHQHCRSVISLDLACINHVPTVR